jgi:hypothetical protein
VKAKPSLEVMDMLSKLLLKCPSDGVMDSVYLEMAEDLTIMLNYRNVEVVQEKYVSFLFNVDAVMDYIRENKTDTSYVVDDILCYDLISFTVGLKYYIFDSAPSTKAARQFYVEEKDQVLNSKMNSEESEWYDKDGNISKGPTLQTGFNPGEL